MSVLSALLNQDAICSSFLDPPFLAMEPNGENNHSVLIHPRPHAMLISSSIKLSST